jgi:hypothetical protein
MQTLATSDSHPTICDFSPNQGHAEKPGVNLEHQLPSATRAFLDRLVQLQLLAADSVKLFLEQMAPHLASYANPELLGDALVNAGLLTHYQVDRVLAGTTHGLFSAASVPAPWPWSSLPNICS